MANQQQTQDVFIVHEFFIFERSGRLLYSTNFSTSGEGVPDEKGKLIYGVLFSFKQMIPALSPPELIAEEGIRSLTTRAYTLHSYESATGYRFALVTSPATPTRQTEIRSALERLYSELFVELVMLDPTYKPATRIDNPVFARSVAQLLQSLAR